MLVLKAEGGDVERPNWSPNFKKRMGWFENLPKPIKIMLFTSSAERGES